jgi:phosphoserine phosphatase
MPTFPQQEGYIAYAVFDLDSTLIQQETIDELAKHHGVYEQVARITKEAMEGKLDFKESLLKRVALLKGLSGSVWDRIFTSYAYTDGARQLIAHLQEYDTEVAIVSGGFTELVEHVAKDLVIGSNFLANRLEYDSEGDMTGRLVGPIVDAQAKRDFLVKFCVGNTEKAMAVGDGANDILMLEAANLSVAFNGKPKVKRAAKVNVEGPSLEGLISYLQQHWAPF